MKKIILISFIFIAFLFNACNESYLDLNPTDAVTTDTYFQNSDDYVLALNGLYDYIQGKDYVGRGGVLAGGLYWDVISDAMYFSFSWHSPWYQISAGTQNPSTGDIGFVWDKGYQALGWANTILAKLDESTLDEAFVKEAQAEVRFLRALIYFQMINIYGDVPLTLTPITAIADGYLTRNPIAEVRTAILDDLDFAISNLAVDPYQGQKGRATKQAAMGIKARVLLYASDWAKAAQASKDVMTLAAQNPDKIGLMDNYDDILDKKFENNKEILFDIQYVSNGSGEGSDNQLPFGGAVLPSMGPIAGGWSATALTPEYIDSYLMKDGLPISQSPLYDPTNPMLNRDPRFYGTFLVPGVTILPDGSPYIKDYLRGMNSAILAKYPINLKKFIDLTANNSSWTQEQEPNWPIIRYADVVLMYAEAQNEAVGPDATVYDAINAIRDRAGMPHVRTGMTQAEMREAIRFERKIELGFEGLRYFDIIRWKIADQVLSSIDDSQYNIGVPKAFHAPQNWLWPVPQTAIDANPNLTQNPGY